MPRQRIPRPIGDWTALKLEQLSAYLDAFARATTKASERYYIDAMAGCGECTMKITGAPVLGSAWRALNVKPRFTGIHLVELDPASADHLRESLRGNTSVHVYEGDCNAVIPARVLPAVSRMAPTLAFLDSTGVEPTWQLLEAIANHRRGRRGEKVELLILFAFDMFINRWLRVQRLWGRLDAFYGDRRWLGALEESTRIGEEIGARRERFVQLYVNRLKKDLKYKHVDVHGPLMKKRRALYQMIFATDHDDGRRIMEDVWRKTRELPGTLFYQRTFDFTPGGTRE